jgi:hypothetical protein
VARGVCRSGITLPLNVARRGGGAFSGPSANFGNLPICKVGGGKKIERFFTDHDLQSLKIRRQKGRIHAAVDASCSRYSRDAACTKNRKILI